VPELGGGGKCFLARRSERWDFVAVLVGKWAFLGGVCLLSGGAVEVSALPDVMGEVFFFFV